MIEKGLFKDEAGVDAGAGAKYSAPGRCFGAVCLVEHRNILGINSRHGH